MKKVNFNRALSLLLALITVLAMVPFSAIGSFAADSVYADTASWLSIGGNGIADNELFAGTGGLAWWLADSRGSGYGYTGDTCYIRLMEDITAKFTRTATEDETNGGYMNLPVNGKKVIDLNGHTLRVTMDLGSGDCDYTGTLFLINGAKLTVVDSTGGGKMATDMYIAKTRTAEEYYFDMFKVTNGGELVLNAPGAEFDCGRSKLQTYYKPRNCGSPLGYATSARNQANGTVVTLESGSKLTVAGGTLLGRGFSYLTDRGMPAASTPSRCSAIKASRGTAVHIVDGSIYGKGGANALNLASGVDLTIESGTFDVSKVDNVTIVKYNGDYNIMPGSYGKVGIPETVLEKLANKNSAVQITKGGHGTTGDELGDEEITTDKTDDRITISLSKGGTTSDSRVGIKPVNNVYSFDPFHGSASSVYKVDLNFYERYFSDTAQTLFDGNYRPTTAAYGSNAVEYYLSWNVSLRKTNGTLVATLYNATTPASQTSISGVNLVSAYGFNNWGQLDVGDYLLRCEVSEVWKGEHSYKSTWKNDVAFSVSDGVLASELSDLADFSLDFNAMHIVDQYHQNAQTISCELDSKTLHYLNQIKKEYEPIYGAFDITVQYSVRSYTPYGEADQSYSVPTLIGNTATVTAADGPGAKIITATISLPRWNSSNSICGYDRVSASKNFLLLPVMQRVTTDFDGVVTSEDIGFENAWGINSLQYIKVDTGIASWGTELAEKGSFSWQWYSTTAHDVDIGTGAHDGAYSEALVSAEGDSYKLTLDGTFRLVCTYTPYSGGKVEEFESVPIDVYSTARQTWYISTLGGVDTVKPTASELTANPLTLTFGDGIWGTVESVELSMRGRPSGVSFSSKISGTPVYSSETKKTYYTFNLYDFASIKEAIADNCAGGTYTFRATIKGKNTSGYSYKEYSNEYSIVFEQASEGYGLIAGGEYLGRGYATQAEAESQVVPLFLDSPSSYVKFDIGFYPQSATYDPDFYGKNVYYYYSVAAGSQYIYRYSGSQFYITSPGTFILKVTAQYANQTKDAYFKVCVPVTHVVVDVPDYQAKLGTKYSELPLENVKLYASCKAGTSAADLLLYNDSYDPIFLVNGYSSDSSKVVTANDKGAVSFDFHLAEGQCFPLEKVYDGKEYMVDLSAVKLTINYNGTSVTKTAEMWDAYMNANEDFCDVKNYHHSTTFAGFNVKQDIHVIEENAVYVDVISIETTVPGVGDPVNENIKIFSDTGYEWQQLGCTCKAADILTMTDIKDENGNDIILVNKSCVSKATGNTAGLPYTDASDAKYDGQNAWMYSTFLNGNYSAGTYYHELTLYTNQYTAADGTKYYFAPDAKVILNGTMLDFARVQYSVSTHASYSYLVLDYFYDVGEVTNITSLDLSNIKPLQGAVPACPDDITVSATADTGVLDNGTVEVGRIEWFVDANGNGQLDSGEELQCNYRYGEYDATTSNIWWDGTFLPGVAYSAFVELSTSNTAIRFASDAAIDCDGYTVTPNGNRSFTVTFDKDYVIRVISLMTAEGTDAASPDGRDPLALAHANPGYYIGSFRVHKLKTVNNPTADTVIHSFIDYSSDLSRSELTGGKYWMILSFQTTSSDYTIADDVKVLINGNDYGEIFTPGRNEIVIEAYELYGVAYYCFEVPATAMAGDVNGDGSINSVDAALILKYDAGSIDLSSEQRAAADYNGDGSINSVDAALILKYDAGID